MIFQIVGAITVFVFTLTLLFFFVEFFLILLFREKKCVILPGLSLKLMKYYYSPLKGVYRLLRVDPLVVDEALIMFANKSMSSRFKKARGEKLIFAPQCLRSVECKARLDPEAGYICRECGNCVIGDISCLCKERGYVLFIVPGDSFVKRIVTRLKPASVIGVACYDELSMAMLVGIRMGIPSVGVPLIRSGCFNTLVELDKIKKNMI
ncbi:DUF116 domain-containing protein [bacterium]|nr:DUF116 domain-containing protein [bacterium]